MFSKLYSIYSSIQCFLNYTLFKRPYHTCSWNPVSFVDKATLVIRNKCAYKYLFFVSEKRKMCVCILQCVPNFSQFDTYCISVFNVYSKFHSSLLGGVAESRIKGII